MNSQTETAANNHGDSVLLDRWIARKIQPVVVLYVALVFAAFGMVAFFVLHSPAAVKALLLAAIGAIAATIPGVMERIEYRLTERGIDRRPLNPKKPTEFSAVFRWDELSRIVPAKHGFKYFKHLDETRGLRRLVTRHFSDRYSGEVHVNPENRDRILKTVEHRVSRDPTEK